jgi:hypothetical protein
LSRPFNQLREGTVEDGRDDRAWNWQIVDGYPSVITLAIVIVVPHDLTPQQHRKTYAPVAGTPSGKPKKIQIQ